MVKIADVLTRQNVTFLIAVAGFLLSVASWIKEFLTQRVRLRMKILLMNVHHNDAFMYLLVSNHSRLPLLITDVAICTHSGNSSCNPRPKQVIELTRKRDDKIIEQKNIYSTEMPIQLSSLGGQTVLLLFENLPAPIPPDATDLTLLVCTNRGRTVKMRLELPADWPSQRISL